MQTIQFLSQIGGDRTDHICRRCDLFGGRRKIGYAYIYAIDDRNQFLRIAKQVVNRILDFFFIPVTVTCRVLVKSESSGNLLYHLCQSHVWGKM